MPAKISGIASIRSVGMLVTPRTSAIWMIVAIVDNTAAAAAAVRISAVFAARAPIAAIVAVLEMKPDARPAIGRPTRGPRVRIATWPAAPMAMTRITRIQIERGFNASDGAIGRAGCNV